APRRARRALCRPRSQTMNVDIEVRSDKLPVRVETREASGELTVGRGPECSLCLRDDHVSRRHAILSVQSDKLRVEDVSSNGRMAGTLGLRGSPAEVPFGTPICIGTHTLVVRPGRVEARGPAREPNSEPPTSAAAPAEAPSSGAPASLRREIHRRL